MNLREFIVANALAALLGFILAWVGMSTLWEGATRMGISLFSIGALAFFSGVLLLGLQQVRSR